MPRYVIEMDEPTDCSECPCFSEMYNGEYCRLVIDDDGLRGRLIESSEAWAWPCPEWCPLVLADAE